MIVICSAVNVRSQISRLGVTVDCDMSMAVIGDFVPNSTEHGPGRQLIMKLHEELQIIYSVAKTTKTKIEFNNKVDPCSDRDLNLVQNTGVSGVDVALAVM